MDAITMLKDDHKRVQRLFRSLEKHDTSVVPEICQELKIHTQLEEAVFYPAVKGEVPDTTEEVAESMEEHHVAKVLIEELESMSDADEQYFAKATVLMEMVRHHIEEEEGEMFPEIRENLGRKRLQEVGQEMAAMKESLS